MRNNSNKPINVSNTKLAELQFEGPKSKGRDRKTWNEYVKVDIKRLGLVENEAHNRDK